MKLSYYIIATDPFETDGTGTASKQIFFSTRSSGAVVLDTELGNLLLNGQFHLLPEDIYAKLEALQFIVPDEENELDIIIGENKQQLASESLLYYVIQPSASCQLGCDYCGQQHEKHNMDDTYYVKVLNRIKLLYIPGQHQGIRIGWFGAEPLMGLPQIRALTPMLKDFAAANEMRYAAKVVTNGLSLKNNIFEELVQEHGVDQIEVTLDGTAPYHDQRRHTKQREASFDIIFNNLKSIIDRLDFNEMHCRISIRCNVDKRNYEGVSPLIKLLADHGFHEKISHFYPIGVYSWGNDAHKKSFSKEEFAEKEIDWLIEMYEHGFTPALIPGRVKQVCLAVSPTSEMIDAFGNIYNCTEVSYVPAYKGGDYLIGNLKFPAETYRQERPLTNWNDKVLNGDFPCTTCKMLPVCGGACPKSWHEDMRACPSNKFNIKEKLMLSYLVTRDNFTELLQDNNPLIPAT